MTAGEFAAIAHIARTLPSAPDGQVWIGDDAAVLGAVSGTLLLSTDMAVAGVHGDLALIGADDFGWRATAGAVSDIAAMGGRAGYLVVAVAGPPATDLGLLYRGVAAASAFHHCPIVGGDLSGAEVLVVTVTVTGTVDGGPAAVTRGGASPGDTLMVTGPLGASAAGLRLLRTTGASAGVPPPADPVVAALVADLVAAHRRPVARLAEGTAARLAGASAMVDVSDGLAADVGHLARASGVGFALDAVPVAEGATAGEALGGGEDYELVIATPDPEALGAAFAGAGLRPPLPIGRCLADPSIRTLAGSPLPRVGWEHAFDRLPGPGPGPGPGSGSESESESGESPESRPGASGA